MKTVVITGRLGLEMVKCFKNGNVYVVISDLNDKNLIKEK